MATNRPCLDDKIDSNLDDEADEQPIRLMAEDCDEIFQDCLTRSVASHGRSLPLEVSHTIKEYHQRFHGWCTFLGVFGNKTTNLDYRLRSHEALQDMVIRMLDMLRQNLFLALTGVKEAISRLNKIGVLIRSSSKSTVTARARRFASQYPKLVRLAEFEDRAYIALQFLYPNASRVLREQLVDSMGDRYARLCYETYRSEANYASAVFSRDVQSAVQRDGIEESPGKVAHRKVSRSPNKEVDEAQEKQQTAHIVIPASSIDTTRLPLNLEEAVSKSVRQSRAGKTLIENSGRLREPDLPSFQEGKDLTSCGWCHQVVDRSVLHATRKKWSEEGRRHYMRDLQPYICLSEDCRESRPSFASSFEWFNHMNADHSDFWSSRIYNQPAWMCIAKHENDSVYTFSLKDELLDHIRVHQCKTWMCTGIHESHSTLAFSSKDALTGHILGNRCNGKIGPESCDPKHPECLVKTMRQASSCPLCLFSMEDQSLNNRNVSDDDGEECVVTSRAMGSHIADHLHHVMTVSLQIMSVMQGSYDEHEGDIQSQSSGSSTAISDLDEEAMIKRLNDLPESVQGSMHWPDSSEGPCEDAMSDLDREKARLPCLAIPQKSMGYFCGRESELSSLDKAVNGLDAQQSFRSTVLYGMGGVGKSEIALQFANKMVDQKAFDVVLWIRSETAMYIEQSLTDMAVRLGLPGAHPVNREESCAILLAWFQKTRKPSARLMSPY
ncbi:unnamed protein product [Alternaria alternata]